MIKLSRHYKEADQWRNLLLHSSLTLTITSSLSYTLGLIRDKTFAYRFGASSQLDIYNSAFVVPDFLFAVLVSGALSAAFVPIFTVLDENSRTKAFTYINQVLSWMLLLLAIFSVIFAIFLPNLVQYLVPGYDVQQRQSYIATTRLLLVAPFFFTLSNTFGNTLLSTRDFLWYGLSPVVYNLGIIVGVLVLAPRFELFGVVLGTVLGALLHLLTRAQAVWRYGFRPHIDLALSKEVRETAWLMLPKMVQIGAWQLMLWWFISLASRVGPGSVTIYNFAYNFQSVPVSLFGIAIALASFSRLSHLSAHNDLTTFKALVVKESGKILGLTSLAALILAIISYPLVKYFLGGGRFDETAVTATAHLLSVYAISVPLESLMHLLSRAHYALKNTWRPSLIHVAALACAIYLSSLLLPRVGLFALPIAFASSFAIQCLLLSLSLAHLLRSHKI